MKIQFLFKPNDALIQYFEEHLGRENIQFLIPKEKDSNGGYEFPKIAEADILLGWRLPNEVLQQAKSCRLWVSPAAGIRHLVRQFRALEIGDKIVLANSHGNAYATAQHMVALLLSVSNCLVLHHELMKSGVWRSGDKEGASLPLRHRKIGLLGYGAINQKVHQLLQAFDSDFFILKNNVPANTPTNWFAASDLAAFLQKIDTLLIAVPHTNETDGMIGEKELALLGKNGLLVNISRGQVVQEKALFEALRNEKIAAAAIDVWYNYRPTANENGQKHPYNYPFHELPNIVLSPHRGASPVGEIERFGDCIATIKQFINGETIKNRVYIEREY